MSSNSLDTSDRSKSFFCHSCSNSFLKHPEAEFLCPTCQLGFIEELPENAETNQQIDDEPPFMRVLNDMNSLLGPIISGSLTGSGFVSNEHSDGSTSSGNQANRGGGPRNRRQVLSFEDILQEILVSITEGANSGRGPMFFNPADYAWGREGLDTIVTQLLNQMDNTGPPPLEKEKIDEIPKREITQDQVDSKMQCSVCWEDFQLSEKVRLLPCSHIYHEDCILPWLQLHGTCPVCRKLLVPEDESNNSSSVPNNTLRFSLSGQASTSQQQQQQQQQHGVGYQESTSNNSSNSSETTQEPSGGGGGGGGGSRRLRDDVEFDFD